MRHGKGVEKLGRRTGNRISLIHNLTDSLIRNDRIITTIDRAKSLKRTVEPIVTTCKHRTVHAIRHIRKKLTCRNLIRKVFGIIGPKYDRSNGGYLRIIRTGIRRGDGAVLALIEFV